MKCLLVIQLVFFAIQGFCQYVTYEFEENNYGWKQDTYGNLFYDQESDEPGFNIPISEANHALRNSTLWVGGRDPANQLFLAGHTLCENGCAYAPGPLTSDGSAAISPSLVEAYNEVWYISRSDVEAHIAYFDCLSDPECDIAVQFPDGYQIPESILNWPAHAEPALGQDFYLAPFADGSNGTEGLYEPELGDYPYFCGDFAVFQVYNDYAGESTITEDPIGLEIQTLVYGYWSPTKNLDNTLFVKHKIINRGIKTLDDTFFGVWTDFSLGNKNDDFVGTDVQRSMVYAYNGGDFDNSSNLGPGYGDDLPAIGLRILGGPLMDEDGLDNEPLSEDFSSYGNQTVGWGDGITDNERMGLAYSMSPTTSGENLVATGLPELAEHYYNFLSGKWKNGEFLRFDNNGYDFTGTAIPTSYVYPGISDPLNAGTNGEDPEYDDLQGWTEISENNAPGDRNMVVSSGSFTMEPGSIQEFEYAYIFVRDSFEPGVPVLETLRNYSDDIVGLDCFYSDSLNTSLETFPSAKLDVRVYPNPTRQQLYVDLQIESAVEYDMFDVSGRSILSGTLNNKLNIIDLNAFQEGAYVLRLISNDKAMVQRIIVVH